jgi:hypothetical protein
LKLWCPQMRLPASRNAMSSLGHILQKPGLVSLADFLMWTPVAIRTSRRADFHTHARLLEPNHPFGTVAEISLLAHAAKPRGVNEKQGRFPGSS